MLTSKCVVPHEHEIETINGQGAQAPLQEKDEFWNSSPRKLCSKHYTELITIEFTYDMEQGIYGSYIWASGHKSASPKQQNTIKTSAIISKTFGT